MRCRMQDGIRTLADNNEKKVVESQANIEETVLRGWLRKSRMRDYSRTSQKNPYCRMKHRFPRLGEKDSRKLSWDCLGSKRTSDPDSKRQRRQNPCRQLYRLQWRRRRKCAGRDAKQVNCEASGALSAGGQLGFYKQHTESYRRRHLINIVRFRTDITPAKIKPVSIMLEK